MRRLRAFRFRKLVLSIPCWPSHCVRPTGRPAGIHDTRGRATDGPITFAPARRFENPSSQRPTIAGYGTAMIISAAPGHAPGKGFGLRPRPATAKEVAPHGLNADSPGTESGGNHAAPSNHSPGRRQEGDWRFPHWHHVGHDYWIADLRRLGYGSRPDGKHCYGGSVAAF